MNRFFILLLISQITRLLRYLYSLQSKIEANEKRKVSELQKKVQAKVDSALKQYEQVRTTTELNKSTIVTLIGDMAFPRVEEDLWGGDTSKSQ